jgi:hypothetical protein
MTNIILLHVPACAIFRESFRSKECTAPLATTHFTLFIWTRSLLIAKIEADVSIHTAQRIQIAENLNLEQLSHSFDITAFIFCAYKFYVFENFNILIIPMRAMQCQV